VYSIPFIFASTVKGEEKLNSKTRINQWPAGHPLCDLGRKPPMSESGQKQKWLSLIGMSALPSTTDSRSNDQSQDASQTKENLLEL
jgi:hypothetical protein